MRLREIIDEWWASSSHTLRPAVCDEAIVMQGPMAQTAHTKLHASVSQSYGDLLRTVLASADGMHAHMPRQPYKQMNDQTNPEMTGGTELVA